jgi:hypothetical protein
MVERLLLDGVNAEPSAATVRRQHHLAADVLPDKAEPTIAVFHRTFTRAEVADDAVCFVVLVPPFAWQHSIGDVPSRVTHRWQFEVHPMKP